MGEKGRGGIKERGGKAGGVGQIEGCGDKEEEGGESTGCLSAL